jgi:hypothetical protein
MLPSLYSDPNSIRVAAPSVVTVTFSEEKLGWPVAIPSPPHTLSCYIASP